MINYILLISYLINKLKIMEHKLNNFKADLYNVFVEGNASSMQMARVFVLLALPVCVVFMLGYHSIKY